MANGRDEKGRFVAGNSFGRKNGGRPPRTYEDKYLRKLSNLVTMKDWEKIILVAISQAKAGDAKARQWLSDYLMGKPMQVIDVIGEVKHEHDISDSLRSDLLGKLVSIAAAQSSSGLPGESEPG